MINIWYATDEHKILSNLHKRVFRYDKRLYISVEHAYQCLKSGEFDTLTYIKDWKCGAKIKGRLGTNKKINRQLMYSLLKISFESNQEAKNKLIGTGSLTLTHKQGCAYWSKVFPELLMEIREEYLEQYKRTGTVTNPTSIKYSI